MKNSKLINEKIAVKLSNKSEQTLGLINLGDKKKEGQSLEIAKECAKIKSTLYIDFTKLDNYKIDKNIEKIISKDSDLSILNISIEEDMAKIINSIEFKEMMDDIKNSYDLVLINEENYQSISYMMAKFEDGKIAFVKENKSKKEKFEESFEELKKLSCPIVGVVYNI